MLTFDGEVACALGLLSSLVGQDDGVVGYVSLLGIFDPQREHIVSLDHDELAALKHSLVVLQPLSLGSLRVHLTVQDNLLAFLRLCVLQWGEDSEFLCKTTEDTTRITN